MFVFVSVVWCQVEVSATSWSFVQRSPNDCGESECDLEISWMGRPWPTGGGCCAKNPPPKKEKYCTVASIVRITGQNGRCAPRLKTSSVVIGGSRICSPEVTGFWRNVPQKFLHISTWKRTLEWDNRDILYICLAFAARFSYLFFTFMWPCIVTNFFVIKPTRCTNFTNLFCHETLHVSDSSSVHHQEFIHCTLSNGICHTGLQTTFEQDQDGTRSILVLLENKINSKQIVLGSAKTQF